MNRELPRPGEIWNHFKNNPYLIIDIAEHTENGKMLVVYRQLYAPFKVYCRPLEMFIHYYISFNRDYICIVLPIFTMTILYKIHLILTELLSDLSINSFKFMSNKIIIAILIRKALKQKDTLRLKYSAYLIANNNKDKNGIFY